MLIRNELYSNGVVVEATIIDTDAATASHEVDGVIKSVRPLTADEAKAYAPKPPTAADQLAAAAQSASQAALEDVRALAPLLQAAADALRSL